MTTPLPAVGGDTGSMPPARARPWALAVLGLTAAVVLAIDASTKQLALSNLEGSPPVRLLGGALYLDLTRNAGAAFSIGVDYTFVFPIIGVLVLGAIAVLVRRLRSLPWALSMGLVVGGVLGNLSDRLLRAPGPLRGHVVDFISVFAEGGRVFPIFNVADSALFCGVVLAILLELRGRRRDGVRDDGVRTGASEGDGSRMVRSADRGGS